MAWGAVTLLACFRLITGADVPVDLVLAFGIGSFVASLALLLVGAPRRRSSAGQVAIALARSGLAVAHLERAPVNARGSTAWLARTADGRHLFVKVVGQDQRDAWSKTPSKARRCMPSRAAWTTSCCTPSGARWPCCGVTGSPIVISDWPT